MSSERQKTLILPLFAGTVASDWVWQRLDDVAVVHDCPHSTPQLVEDRAAPFVVRSQDVRTGTIQLTSAARVSDSTYAERTKKAEPRHGDLVYSREGTYFGIAAEVPKSTKVCLGQRMVLIRPNSSTINPKYLKYWLNSSLMAGHIHGFRDGTVAERLNLPVIRGLCIACPALTEQAEIADLLGSLDDRIALLRETNATLEAIAQALFKSWFVDFDPVRAKRQSIEPTGVDEATVAMFPAALEMTDFGLAPSGWSIRSLEEITKKVGMGPFGSNIKVSTFVSEGVPMLSGAHLRGELLEDGEFKFITAEHADRLKNSCVRAGDIVLTHRGTIGQVALIPQGSQFPEYVLSQSQFFFRCDGKSMRPEWMLYFLKSPAGQHLLLANASQVGVPSIARPVSYLRSVKLIVPSSNLIHRFSDIAASLHQRVVANKSRLRTLTTLRDTLLPRLISGQLRLPDVLPDANQELLA